MECSTTELRQHARDHRRIGPKGPQQAGRFLPQAPRWRKHAVSQKDPDMARKRHRVPVACLSWQAPARSGSSSSRKAITALARPIRDLEFCHFAGCTVCSDNSGAKKSRSGEAIEQCQPSRVFCWVRRRCIFSLIGDFLQTTELRQVHDER